MSSAPSTRSPGRPRSTDVDAAILRAAIELVTAKGAQGATLAAVARRAGVARATVYLRWPNRSALLGAAARAAVGGRPIELSDDVEHDIRYASEFIRQVFADPAFRAVVPEIVRGVLANPPDLEFDFAVPRRREFGRRYKANAAGQGFDPSVDPHLAFDVILGTELAYLLANGRPMSKAKAEQLGEVLIRALRRPEAPGSRVARAVAPAGSA